MLVMISNCFNWLPCGPLKKLRQFGKQQFRPVYGFCDSFDVSGDVTLGRDIDPT